MHEPGAQRASMVAGGQAAIPVVLDHVVIANPHPPPQMPCNFHPGNAGPLLSPAWDLPAPLQQAPLLQGHVGTSAPLL